ncbi:MAG: hypothetical protein CM1200mP38_6240 [Dehalococcoidia bacterium]|nr:MAG: hypothetical protein CM1200mP38_6240 [Dehalococcoidia bacterium]
MAIKRGIEKGVSSVRDSIRNMAEEEKGEEIKLPK